MRLVRRFIHNAAAAAVVLAAPAAHAQSGATLTPDRLSYMVNKDLAGERWTINLNLASASPPSFLNATGNVFRPDGSPPVFVLCQLRADSTGTLEDPSSELRFTCQGADPCATTATECARESWSSISADVPIPASFFLPPGGNGAAPAVAASAAEPRARGALARIADLWSSALAWLVAPSQVASVGPRAAHAQDGAPRGATLTYDGFNYLVNKDLAGERWSISLNLVPVPDPDGTVRSEAISVTGNVFKPDGSPPSFIYCVPRPDSTGTLEDPSSTFRFTCRGSSACGGSASECAESSWQPLGDDVALPASFLLPPGGLPATPQSDPDIIVIGRTSDPPSIISPEFTLGEEAAAAGGIAGACPVARRCFVRVGGCDAVPGRVVEPDGGGCGCRIDELPVECVTCGGGASGSCGNACAFAVGSRNARGLCLPWNATGVCGCYPVGARQALALRSCGGPLGAACPAARCCVDDPRDGCDAQSGVDCAGVCVPGQCEPQGDCVDASGDYSGTSSVSGSCSSPAGEIPISGSDASSFTLVQQGCALQARSNGETFATGTVSGNELTLTGTAEPFPIEGCSQETTSQTFTGTLVGDDLELSGTIESSASCEFGDISCELQSDVSVAR
ncbi:MAG: hypothetical protein AB1689_29410 [Thermodesulfobacteriota bacterium]